MSQQTLFCTAVAALGLALGGCAGMNAPLPEVDWADYRADPEAHAGQRTLIRVSLATVNADPEAFSDKELILTGTVGRVAWRSGQPAGPSDWFRWHFVLEDGNGEAVRCYEETYRTEVWTRVLRLARQAESERGPVTAVGRYRPGYGLELDWIIYADTTLDTDHLPPRARILLQ